MVVARPGWLLLAALWAGLGALPLSPQTPELGAFAGTVHDEQGQPLAGATVVFRSLDIEQQRQIQTDKDGRFYYAGFRPGRYRITILRGGQVLWSFQFTLPPFQEVVQLDIDLKKLREAAARIERLDPELERQRDAERQRRQRDDELQGHFTRGARHLGDGQPEAAIQELEAARQMEPERGTIYGLLAAATAAAGRPEQAIALYRRALELEPDEAAHHNNLGTLLARRGNLDEALAHFDRAARLDPNRSPTYFFNRGAALLNAGRPADALPALEQAVRRDPTLAVAHYFLGLVLFRTSPRPPRESGAGHVQPQPGTREAFERYLQLEPDGEFAGLARDYLKQLSSPPPSRPQTGGPPLG